MKPRTLLQKSSLWLANLTVGGLWGRSLAPHQQRNLRWFWFDGLFSSASDNIMINFVSLYILALGASEAQIGLMSSFSSIACAILLLPGALLAERLGRRKLIALFCYGGARLAILLLVFVPILFKGPNLVWIAIGFSVLRDSFTNLAYPAWMDVINEIVPIEGRGRYFGSRNFIMNVTGMIATLLAGKLITLFVTNQGYQIALGLAFVLGAFSTFSYSHIRAMSVPAVTLKGSGFSLRKITSMLKGQPQFIALVVTAAFWNFAVNISSPFFNVYMVHNLKFTATSVGFLAVVSILSTLATQNQIGALADRVSARRLQLAGMLMIPLLPFAWLFATQVWHVAIINTFSGVMWGLYNLVSFNLLLASIPHDQVPWFSAVYQVIVMLSLALGALVGSTLIARWSFIPVLIVSGACRFLATAFFAWKVHDPPQTVPAA